MIIMLTTSATADAETAPILSAQKLVACAGTMPPLFMDWIGEIACIHELCEQDHVLTIVALLIEVLPVMLPVGKACGHCRKPFHTPAASVGHLERFMHQDVGLGCLDLNHSFTIMRNLQG